MLGAIKKPSGSPTRRVQRSARDSNPQALSGARFRGECNTILPALQSGGMNKAAPPSTALQIGAPGFEPGTSATRTQRSTGLSHAPDPTRVKNGRGPNNGRGGIRTHAGVSPHDFQSCALSHSATRPKQQPWTGPTCTTKALGLSSPTQPTRVHGEYGGSGIRTHAVLPPTP